MMRKLFILLMVLSCYCCRTFAQNRTTDSLSRLLETAKEDTSKVMLMYQLSRVYLYSKAGTSLSFAQQGVALSHKINFKKGEGSCLRTIGDVFISVGNYPSGLYILLQAQKIAEDIKDNQMIGRILSNISNIYSIEGDMKRTVAYAHKAIVFLQKSQDSMGISIVTSNLGNIYEGWNQLDSALIYTKLGYSMALSQNDIEGMGISLNNLGNIFLKSGKTDSAMMDYRLSVPYLKQAANDEAFAEACLGMAKVFLQQNKTDSSLYYAKLSFAVAKSKSFTDKILDASNFLAEYYKSERDIDSAYVYQAATIAAKDSLFSQQKANEFQGMTYDEDIRQQQMEDAKEQARVQARQNALIGGLVTLLLVAFLLVRNNRQRKKANALLQKQKEEIDNKAQELSVQKDSLQQSYDNVELLGEIGRKITASLSVEKIIGTVYNNINSLMDAAVFGIGIYSDNLKRLEFPATYEDGKALPAYSNSLDDQNRFGPVCFNGGKEIIIGNLEKEYKDHVKEVSTPHEGGQPVSIIFLPLTAKEEKLGVITVQSFKENAYSEYHLFMLRNIATYTAIAIENAESFDKLNQTVSTLKSTQSQLIQSEKMASLGELTAGIAHEIQNPLNFVNNFSEVNNEMLDEITEEINKGNYDEVKNILNDIKDNSLKINHHGKRADAIVKGMLQHSRLSAGAKEPTDINALCDEYLRLSYHGLRAKDKSFNADFKTDFEKSIGKINIVPQDIGRVLLNIFNNAFYAVQQKEVTPFQKVSPLYKPLITASTKKINDKVEIKVSDNGSGIPQNIIDKIFQPFFTTKPTGEGTGLGLSLSYDIIKAHGGEIKVETKEGEGSTFVIQLP